MSCLEGALSEETGKPALTSPRLGVLALEEKLEEME